ncbi:MAG: carbohydrate-binding protein [Flavobacteriaceae bacterium]|nr:carbohydrate-binding protein [Flavobacteriaceae bacterium]MBD10554.1 carbohydrate-binding protein [Flavobacteriaceae bacterium]|tara:strand:+ start:2313 stop:3806 length:1494 start_codon:yes stop_codon:yes gene_type:complete
MKYLKQIQTKTLCLLSLVSIVLFGCERDLPADAPLATFPNIADVFTDVPVNLTDEFFISFDPSGGANVNGFGTDENEAYQGTTSIRIDVPAANNPDGGFIGGIFRDRGEGRNLTQYDALTFWAKGSTTGTIGEVGFGADFLDDKFPVSRSNIQLTTDWKKYVVPIPDASKLTQEKGMFLFAAGGLDVLGDGPNGNEIGWTFWLDEIRFENLGTNLAVNTEILNGEDQVVEAFTGSNITISGLSQTVNLGTGENVNINIAPAYFDFINSNSSVATVSESGLVSVVGSSGTTTITAILNNIQANGSLEVTSNGQFPSAPIPTRDSANVISLFSDAYTNVPVRHYNGFFEPYQTTLGGAGSDPNNVDIQGMLPDGSLDNIINYTQLNFVSIGTYETVQLVDASTATHLHIDINVRETIDAADFIRLELESGTFTGTTANGSFVLSSAALSNVNSDGWASIDVPLASFSGAVDFSSLGQLFFISDGTISNIWVDNVYYYNE